MVRELLTQKDQLTDKTGLVSLLFNDLIGESFLFSKGDAHWKAKRQACAHAFYKDRIAEMMQSLKRRCEGTFDKWTEEIKASPEGSKVIDIAKEVEGLLAQNIIMIAFGEDIND